MLNGRFGDREWTYISPLGKSVVDYICVPYEQMSGISGFDIHKMSDIIASSQATVFESVFYSLHTVAALSEGRSI